MIVHEDECCRAEIERAADYLSYIDRGLIDRALADQFVANQNILAVQMEHPHPLHVPMLHISVQIIEHGLPPA